MKKITHDTYYVGVDDEKVDLFEGQYQVPNGVCYNSYVIVDQKIAVMDTVDKNFGEEWLDKVDQVLQGAKPDYLIVQHMEPDHSACIKAFLQEYPNVTIVGNAKTFIMIKAYFGDIWGANTLTVKDGDTLCLGDHTLQFIFAPMVHWPEVMMTYDQNTQALFSADAFGRFGIYDEEEAWDDEARRYYIGIVGKYGAQVQGLLKKLAPYSIQMICPLHGVVLKENLPHYLDLYQKWSTYTAEEEGVFIGYTTVYGNTQRAVMQLAGVLKRMGIKTYVADLARVDRAKCVASAFKYSKMVLATTTYNGTIFPAMREFIDCLVERNYQNRTVGLVENGSWAPWAVKTMQDKLQPCKNLTLCHNTVKILGAVNDDTQAQIMALAQELAN